MHLQSLQNVERRLSRLIRARCHSRLDFFGHFDEARAHLLDRSLTVQHPARRQH